MDAAPSASGLEAFAQANGLRFTPTAQIPHEGALANAGGAVEGAVAGSLPGGLDGTIAHYTYTTTSTDSDGHTSTEHHRFTIVVTRIPESIGCAPLPALPRAERQHRGGDRAAAEAGERRGQGGPRAFAYKGTSDDWLTQLFSPAFCDWLGRSADDFGFDLSAGVLTVFRAGYLNDRADLEGLCSDAAHVAQTIAGESREAIDSGAAASEGARSEATDPHEERLIAVVVGGDVPDHLGATADAFRRHLLASPATYVRALWWAGVIALVANVFLAAITINLIVAHSYTALAVFEGAILLLVFFVAVRWSVAGRAKALDPKAFFQGYARSRHLKVVDPLRFAATHAEAKLPFKPDWVFAGELPGGSGDAALALKGDGTKREDRIAVVAGPSGPVASAELQATAPGLSLRDLDAYAERLSKQLAGAPAPIAA